MMPLQERGKYVDLQMASPQNKSIWTVGHSSRTLEEFLELLRDQDIELIADVRRFPGSRRHPHFSENALRSALEDRGMAYVHFPELGGRRGTPSEDSPNTGWRVQSFAAYADYMATNTFAEALERLEAKSAERRTAIMCAEAVPWRCHRRLIADALIINGWTVLDIMNIGKAPSRELTSFAQIVNGRLIYPKSKESSGSGGE